MSAYIVSKDTIDRAVGMLLIEGVITTKEDASAWGKRMWLMNIEAVDHRYGRDMESEAVTQAAYAYEFKSRPSTENVHQMLKSLRCLTYQCCEGNVPDTPLYKLLVEIENRPHLEVLTETPDYKQAEWG